MLSSKELALILLVLLTPFRHDPLRRVLSYVIMAKDFAKQFYHSQAWVNLRNSYAKRRHYLCEDCLAKGEYQHGDIVHHVIELTPDNIHDKSVTLNEANLKLVCRSCHKRIHDGNNKRWVVDEWGKISPK